MGRTSRPEQPTTTAGTTTEPEPDAAPEPGAATASRKERRVQRKTSRRTSRSEHKGERKGGGPGGGPGDRKARRAQLKADKAAAKEREREAAKQAGPTPRQLPALLRAAHPRQALAFAVVVGVLVALTRDNPTKEALVGAATVLVAQLALGLINDLCDVELDRASGVTRKPIAAGVVPPGNASFVVILLLLLLVPLSLQNGITAGLILLGTVVIGFVHDRWLHRTPLSFVGWAATCALLPFFVTYGGWGRDAQGSAPLTSFIVLCALLGVCVHFLTSLPDLVADNQARVRHLPLRVAMHTGAPRLLVGSAVLTVIVVVAIVVTVAQAGAIAH